MTPEVRSRLDRTRAIVAAFMAERRAAECRRQLAVMRASYP